MLHRFVLQLNMTASLLDDDGDAEANIYVDGDVDNEATDDVHQGYYYQDIVKEGDYYPQERGEPALATFTASPITTPGTYTGTRGSEKRNKADTVHILVDTDDEDNSTSSGGYVLSTVAQRRPPAPDLLDNGANRYVFGNTTATITDRKEARVTSLKNISSQARIIKQATVQPLWIGGTGRAYSPTIKHALIDQSLDFSLLPVSHFDTEQHKDILFQNGQAFILRQPSGGGGD
eukprot:g58211.t1